MIATVNYLYRSQKDKAFLNLRLLFTHNNINHVIGGKTKLDVSKLYWEKYHPQKNPKDIEVKNQQVKINTELNKIENHILKAFHQTSPENVNKEWLTNQLDLYYNPPKKAKSIPDTLLAYFDYYLNQRHNELAKQTLKNYKVVRKLIDNYENSNSRKIRIADVDPSFKADFQKFCLKNAYAHNTIARAILTIKTVCKHAMFNGLEVSPQLDRIKIKEKKANKIYLTLDELKTIEDLDSESLNESLLNARDWLIISCFTGQRVSDFMRFTKDLVRTEKGEHLIEFTQNKTRKIMTIPLHPSVMKILKKRSGAFPRPISSQKYNSYIKKVCKIAGINQMVKGSKRARIDMDDDSYVYRKKAGEYEKWELVGSHIGRWSFSSNFYGKIPTTYLTYMTGHSTEEMFLNYLGKSNKDIALELTKYF